MPATQEQLPVLFAGAIYCHGRTVCLVWIISIKQAVSIQTAVRQNTPDELRDYNKLLECLIVFFLLGAKKLFYFYLPVLRSTSQLGNLVMGKI